MNNMVEVKQVEKKLPFKHGEAPQIKFGADFEALEDRQKIMYLKKFSSSMNHAADLIQKERNDLVQKLITSERQVHNANLNVEQIQKTMTGFITDSNLEKQELLAELTELRKG